MEKSVFGCRLPSVSRSTSSTSRTTAQPHRLALGLQLPGERTQGEACVLAIRTLGLEPCAQKLKAQRVAVLVPALAAAVGRVLPWARAPPSLEAVFVDELGGAATGARLHERSVVFIPETHPTSLLLLTRSHLTRVFLNKFARGVKSRSET